MVNVKIVCINKSFYESDHQSELSERTNHRLENFLKKIEAERKETEFNVLSINNECCKLGVEIRSLNSTFALFSSWTGDNLEEVKLILDMVF